MPAFIVDDKQQIAIDGELTFATVKVLCDQVTTIFVPDANKDVNLQAVTVCDSASVVLLLMIVQRFGNTDYHVRFRHVPSSITTLINLYNLSHIIESV